MYFWDIFFMIEIPKSFYRDGPPESHTERVDRIARHLGGYLGIFARGIGITDYKDLIPPDIFPEELWSTITTTRHGAHDPVVRHDPYLSHAFPLFLRENISTIFWEVMVKAPEIALYATGDLYYAQSVDIYLRRNRS